MLMNTFIKLFIVTAITLSLLSCGGGDDGAGGIIGTGIKLKGTVPTNRAFAQSEIEIRSANGERTTTAIAENGRYSSDSISGESPYLLRVDLGNDQAYYHIAYSDLTVQNVHAYTDLAIRNWFSTQGRDIDSEFAQAGIIDSLPTQSQISAINSRISALIARSLSDYGLSGTNLTTVSFDSNDTGVDEFLDKSPVLINNGTITIVISDQATGKQAVVSNNIPVNTDLGAEDLFAPDAPTSLRVLPSASNEIVLAWNSANDNVGVVAYEVFRDGEIIATTTYPSYIDTGLASNINFRYSIVAIDSSGNRSQISAEGQSTTLASPDIVPPPSPTSINLEAGSTSVFASWAQTQIGDVAEFIVLRGRTRAMLERVSRVTSTFITDAALNSGNQYCYQVIAVDASENESNPSEIQCITTTGTAIKSPSLNLSSGNSLLDVDVSALVCDTPLSSYDIQTTVILSLPCYRVDEDITVSENGQLIVSAGTVLKFSTSTKLEVRTGGSLTVNGSESNPVVFSGLNSTPGYWDGVIFRNTNRSRNTLNYLVVEHGGTPTGAALRTFGFTGIPVRISVDNVLIRYSAGDGFDFDPLTIIEQFTNVISTDNNRAGMLSAMHAAFLGSESSFSGNATDGVLITDEIITGSTQWSTIDAEFLISRLRVEAPFSIAEGSVLRFSSGGSIRVSSEGSMSAIGTETQPILMTGVQNTPGFWEGIEYYETNSTNNRLEHVIVEYAGSGGASSAGVRATGFSVAPVRIALKNTVLRFNDGPGFRFGLNTVVMEFEDIISTSNLQSGVINPAALQNLGSRLDLQGNTDDSVRILDAGIDIAATWPTLNVPYRFDQLRLDADLRLSPGTVLLADRGASISVLTEGSLNAVGTIAQPISIVGSSSIQGHWDGISYASDTNSALNVLDNVILSHGGGSGNSATSGNIELSCFSFTTTRLTILNSSISDSLGWGIFQSGSLPCDFITINNVSFPNNLSGGISPL